MSGKVSGMVWELDIPHPHAWILMSLADHAEHDGSQVFPGNGLTAWKTGYSVAYIKRIIGELKSEKYELLELVNSGGGGQRAEYRICLENFERHKKEPIKRRGAPKGNQNATKQTGEPELPPLKNKPGNSQNKGGNSTRARVETSVETSYSRRDAQQADASPEEKENSNYFATFCEQMDQVGLMVSPEDRERVPGNLKCIERKQEVTPKEMYRVLVQMVQARLRGYPLSPQDALNDVRGVPRKGGIAPPRGGHLRDVSGGGHVHQEKRINAVEV